MRQKIFTFFISSLVALLVVVSSSNAYVLLNDSSIDMFYIQNILLNSVPGFDPEIPCKAHQPCFEHNAICDSKLKKCVCPPYSEFDDLGNCIECPLQDHFCGFSGCCGSNTLVCYYNVCTPCVRESGSNKCITKEQLMYSTLSQISLALAMVLGILALVTLLYKTCKRPNTMFGHSQRLTGNRQAISVIESERRASISSTQRRVLNQLRDRPPRYEREQSIVTTTPTNARDTTIPSIHAIGEPPPLYSEVPGETSDTIPHQEIEPPPAYSTAFPTISTLTLVSEVNTVLEEDEEKDNAKDEVASGSSESIRRIKEQKPIIADPESDVERNIQR